MFDAESLRTAAATSTAWSPDIAAFTPTGLTSSLSDVPMAHRLMHPNEYLFRSGEARQAVYLVRAGFFKVSVLSPDGREKITGFRMNGDLLGLDALGSPAYTCDVVALDVSDVLEIPCAHLASLPPRCLAQLTAALAQEVRRDWEWMLATSSLNAERRVASFLVDLAARQRALGYSAVELALRMSRAEIGNFLALQLETVTRALSHLQSIGLIAVARRDIRILDVDALRRLGSGDAPVVSDRRRAAA
jgi:CRP/FNR family transcriptional regulator